MARPRKLTEIDPDTRTAHCTDCAGRVAVVPFRRPNGSTAWRCAAKKKAAANRWAVRHDPATSWRTVGNGAAHGDYLGTATRRPTRTGHDGDKATIADMVAGGHGVTVSKESAPCEDRPSGMGRPEGDITPERKGRWSATTPQVVASVVVAYEDDVTPWDDSWPRNTGGYFRWAPRKAHSTAPKVRGGRPGPVLYVSAL